MQTSKIKKINKFFSVSIIVFFILFSAFYFTVSFNQALAQDKGTPTNISISCATYKYPWCQEGADNPSGLINRFYQIALGLAGAAALGVLIYGAILWTVSGAVSTKKDAMDWIFAAIWGLVLLLAAYLILYTINPELIKLKSPEDLFESMSLNSAPAAASVLPPAPGLSGTTLGEDYAREQLAQNNIGVKPQCASGQAVNCVNLAGIRQDTINELGWLRQACSNCNVFVTGGTEAGHTEGTLSHDNGYKADLRTDPRLSDFIVSNFTYSRTRSDGARVYTNPVTGSFYALESDHWDILVP
jgi:hypothetical protein